MKPSEKKQFFNDLSIAVNTLDIQTTKSFYYALVRFVVKNLTEKDEAELPDLGKLRLATIKDRVRGGNLNLEGEVSLPAVKTIKFNADYKLNRFINKRILE